MDTYSFFVGGKRFLAYGAKRRDDNAAQIFVEKYYLHPHLTASILTAAFVFSGSFRAKNLFRRHASGWTKKKLILWAIGK